MNKKQNNCWEFTCCGREPGGKNEQELGVCPVTTAVAFNGMHDGRNGGRVCWAVAATLCKGEVQGHFANKAQNCSQCEFFKQVCKEEGTKHLLAIREILSAIKK